MEDMTIRNFSKDRYENIYTSVNEFLRRIKKTSERKKITESLQLQLILRFLFSDFLDRKLQAVTLLTSFLKICKHSVTVMPAKELERWIRENKILPAIYNEKSHSELINRSTDFMQLYLITNPPLEDLSPLL